MNNTWQSHFLAVGGSIIDYLPNLLAGLILLVAGLGVGWVAKRMAIHLLRMFRIERMFTSYRWGADLLKADVRYVAFNILGNIVLLVVFISFLSAAMVPLKLHAFQDALNVVVAFFPRVLVACAIFALGWKLANRLRDAALKGLMTDQVPRAMLQARLIKVALLVFFAAMSFVVLNIAKTVVLIGFTVAIVTIGLYLLIVAFASSMSGRDA